MTSGSLAMLYRTNKWQLVPKTLCSGEYGSAGEFEIGLTYLSVKLGREIIRQEEDAGTHFSFFQGKKQKIHLPRKHF